MSLVSPSLQNGLRRYIRDEWRDSDIGRNVVKTELGVVVCTVIAVAYFIILLVFSFKYDLPPMWPIFFTASALLFALSVAFMGLIAARTRDMRRLKVLTICGAIGLVYSAWKIFTTARISVFFCDDWDPWGSRDADIGSTAFVPEAIPASMVAAYLRDGDDDGGGGTAWTDDGDSGYGYATTTNRLEPYECDPTYQMLSIAVFALFVIFSIPLLMIVKVLRYKIYRAHFALDDNGTILIGRRRTRGGDEEALPAIEEVIVIVDEAEARAIEKDEECCVCYDEPRNTVFLECGHMATGINCARRVRDCPLCRAPIEKIIWRRPANAPDGPAPDASDSSNNDGDGTGTATTTTTGTSTTTQSSIGVGTSTGRRKSIKDKGKGKGKGGTGGGPGTAVGGATKARGASLSDSDLSSVSSRGRRLAGGLSFSSTESDNDGHGTAAAAAAALDADDRCSVCEAKPRDTMLMNCGHRVACVDCAADIDECPVCHQEVARRVQIFK